MIWTYTLLSVIAISLISLIGIFTLSLKEDLIKKYTFLFVSLSVGALFGDVFFHLIPHIYEASEHGGETLEHLHEAGPSFKILLGILLFFILEKFLHWRHDHCTTSSCETHSHNIEPLGYMNLISDGIHNFVDGALIAASYMISIPVGIATTIAIALHEIPQEIGDFGVLLHSGFSKGKALLANFTSGLLAIVGAVLTLSLPALHAAETLLPLAAGGFIYIAGSDLVPELKKHNSIKNNISQLSMILLGLVIMYGLTFME